MKQFVGTCCIVLLVLLCVACPATPYGKAGALGLNMVDAIHTGADTLDQLRVNGTINSNEERQAMKYLNSLNEIVTGPYKTCVQSAHAAGGQAAAFAACANDVTKAIDNPMLLRNFNITNPNSVQNVQTVTLAIDNLVQTAVLGFGQLTAKGK